MRREELGCLRVFPAVIAIPIESSHSVPDPYQVKSFNPILIVDLATEHDIRPLLVNLSQQCPIHVRKTGKPVALPRVEMKDLMS
jgi:hypothetical protein